VLGLGVEALVEGIVQELVRVLEVGGYDVLRNLGTFSFIIYEHVSRCVTH